jgi:hypothetical protein
VICFSFSVTCFDFFSDYLLNHFSAFLPHWSSNTYELNTWVAAYPRRQMLPLSLTLFLSLHVISQNQRYMQHIYAMIFSQIIATAIVWATQTLETSQI